MPRFELAILFIVVAGLVGLGCGTSAKPIVVSPARTVRLFSSEKASAWMHWSGMALADVVNEDETPGVKLGGVGFMRAPAGATSAFDFAYDEVLVITKGRCSITSGRETLTAGTGQALYLPAGVPGTFRVDEDVELVYVASSPYGEVNRKAKADLLKQAEHGAR